MDTINQEVLLKRKIQSLFGITSMRTSLASVHAPHYPATKVYIIVPIFLVKVKLRY